MTCFRHVPRSRILFVCVTLVPFLLAGRQMPSESSQATRGIDDSSRVVLRGNTDPRAESQFDRGPAPDSQPVNRILLLLQRSPQQESVLRRLLDTQQARSSPDYHRWLTPSEFGRQFGPADADIEAVSSWLTSDGFAVKGVSAGKTIIEFSGNVGQIRRAFRTQIHRYVINHTEYLANASDPQIPVAFSAVIAGFASLNNFRSQMGSRRLILSENAEQTEKPSPQWTTQKTSGGTEYAIGPYDFAKIYNSLPLWNATRPIDGTGQSVALAERTDICTAGSPDFPTASCNNRDDVQAFREYFGLPLSLVGGNSPVQVIVNGPNPGLTSDETEALIDVDAVGGVAKGARIEVVVSQTTEATPGFDLSAEYIVDNNLAPVMSLSFMKCEAEVGPLLFYDMLWEQAAAQGITVVVSSGDSGSAGCDDEKSEITAVHGLAVNGIASTPFNVAVGGTDFDDAGNQTTYWSASNDPVTKASAMSYIPEIPWNDSCAAGGASECNAESDVTIDAGGGGESACAYLTQQLQESNPGASDTYCLKPAWQSGLALTGFESTDGVRDLPDVSLFGASGLRSESAFVVCQSDRNNPPQCPPFDFVYGTSNSAPAFAGIMAMVNQYMVGQGDDIGRQGNANYVLYDLAAEQVSAGTDCVSEDVKTGNNCIFYDITTGNNSVPCAGGTPDCSATGSGAIGVLVNSSNIAWSAGPGYDLATGLGTINVANLVHAWGSLPYLISSPNTSPANEVKISQGQTGSSAVTVQFGPATPSVTLSCEVSPANVSHPPTCAFTPTNVLTASGQVMLTLTTTAGSHVHPISLVPSSTPGLSSTRRDEVLLTVIIALLIFALPKPAYGRAWTTLLLLSLATLVAGCHGRGTTPGVYAVTVSGAPSGAQPITVYFDLDPQ